MSFLRRTNFPNGWSGLPPWVTLAGCPGLCRLLQPLGHLSANKRIKIIRKPTISLLIGSPWVASWRVYTAHPADGSRGRGTPSWNSCRGACPPPGGSCSPPPSAPSAALRPPGRPGTWGTCPPCRPAGTLGPLRPALACPWSRGRIFNKIVVVITDHRTFSHSFFILCFAL